ncbi:membrane-associated protein, putative, partial [Bodo saltans]
MTQTLPLHVMCLFATVFYVVVRVEAATGTFGTNLVQGGDSTVSGASNFWGRTSDCEMKGSDFSVDGGWTVFKDYDCYMTQSIDITFARNYLLNLGGRVMISMQGYIQGRNPDYASLTLTLLECTSGNEMYTLGGNQLTSSSWQTYMWGMRLPPNICKLGVQLYLRNHAPDGDVPSANTISVILTGTPATHSAPLAVTETATNEETPTSTFSITLENTQTATLSLDITPTQTLSPEKSTTAATASHSQSTELSETGHSNSRTFTNSSSPPSGSRSRDSNTLSISPTNSSTPTASTTASLSQSRSPTLSISTSASPIVSYSASQSNSASTSADGRTATATAVTFTGNYSETVGQLTLTRTLLLTASKIFHSKTNRHSPTATLSFNETTGTTALAQTNASSTPTFITPVVSTSASVLPLRTATPLPNATMTLTFIVPPPATQAPVSLVAETALTSVTTAAILAAASSAAGPASMQAIMFQASCGEGGSAIGSAGARSSTMYLVSPFIGDSFAMVGGNIGLMFGFLLLHVCVLMVARCTALGK